MSSNEEIKDEKSYTESIELTQEAFKHLENASRIGIDIGGSLAKIAYSSSYEYKTALFSDTENNSNSIYSVNEIKKTIPTLNFIKFETKYIDSAVDYIKRNLSSLEEPERAKSIRATGGGSHKYKELLSQKLDLEVKKEDEMSCLIMGCNFLLRHVPNEVFTIDYDTLEYEFKPVQTGNIFPYLLVNIGSGVSILKVESDDNFQRVGGSTIGGATLWGLGSLLTDAKNFDEIIELAEKGDNRNVDMLVKDIYGGSYDLLGLNDDLIASSLGKTTRSSHESVSREEYLKKFKQEDLARSVLIMICYDISQIATLHARIHNIDRIYFGGYFIHNCRVNMKFLKHGISYWSQGKMECLFLRHEGYLGAIGAFLKISQELDHTKYSWFENYAHSSTQSISRKRNDSNPFDCFELNQEDHKLVTCPLLDHESYIPDLVDLTKDEEARSYWLSCFERTIETYEKQCIKSYLEDNDEQTLRRASDFKKSYLNKLNELKESPFAFGRLTVRSLLDLREHCMAEFQFFDVYSNEKRDENKHGLELLGNRLDYIENINDLNEKWKELFRGFLAGNVYDYGAQSFIEKQKMGHLEKFTQALNSIDDSFHTMENYTDLIDKLKFNQYKCICIFVDNSGFDLILGVLPFVIEILKNKETKIILCANSKAAINDVTYQELTLVIKKACLLSDVLNDAFYKTQNLILIENGSASPCLDLSRININLAKAINFHKVDLIILEGMGRAVHTNFDAKFKCDSLKSAVIKNKWLAEKFKQLTNLKDNETKFEFLKEDKFPVLFKFEKFFP
ncbi:unnamed protein product [Brachionus calyciflorus]|uniref:4'-phosphopantetheine phosphatase n=1 Tax=Brachionus calyciflorus TaxID=104777 RepID=A0A813VUV5_9BILA|nr:unnamed protein product [Brachionus calyciflorus]